MEKAEDKQKEKVSTPSVRVKGSATIDNVRPTSKKRSSASGAVERSKVLPSPWKTMKCHLWTQPDTVIQLISTKETQQLMLRHCTNGLWINQWPPCKQHLQPTYNARMRLIGQIRRSCYQGPSRWRVFRWNHLKDGAFKKRHEKSYK